VRSTSRLSGDFSEGAKGPWDRACPVPCTWLRQFHGREVVLVAEPGACRGAEADAAVSASAGAGLAVLTADCAPVALACREGAVGIVHAGWRGVVAGVVEAAVGAMERLGAKEVFAALGPCIWPHAYDFSPADLDTVASLYGKSVRAVSASGQPALDLPAAVAGALERAGAVLLAVAQTCTHCSPAHWSWRAGRDRERQATVVWRPGP
jgi:YfiH family protein